MARFLIEPTFDVPLSDDRAFHFGAGLGAAQGRTEETVTCTGTACTSSGAVLNNSSTWTGLAWEVSPYFSVRNGVFGLRYAGFPKFKGNDNNSRIEWTTAGIFAGFKF